jgi:ankyrin repeat protein
MRAVRVLMALALAGFLLRPARLHADPTIGAAAYAVFHDKTDLLKTILDRKPELIREKFDCFGSELALLHLAAHVGYRDSAAVLLDRGADMEAKSSDGTPLQIAVSQGHTDLAEFLLRKGARLDIHSAAGLGKGDEVKQLLKVNPALARSIDCPLETTPLHWAAEAGHLEVARVLLSYKADASAAAPGGITPLHYAMHHDQAEMVKLLLAAGAKIDRKNDSGETPLYRAVVLRKQSIARILLEGGADVNARLDRERYPVISSGPSLFTPLHVAAQRGDVDMIELLVSHKADVKAKCRWGSTPLDLWRRSDGNPLVQAQRLVELAKDEALSAHLHARDRILEVVHRVIPDPPGR